MKTLRQIEDKILTAIMVVALMVPLILVAVSQGSQVPTLSFEGARIIPREDGSIQLLFDVCIKNAEMTDGAAFTLHFNPQYIEPSNYTTNVGLKTRENPMLAFQRNPELYKEYNEGSGQFEPADPFKPYSGMVSVGRTDGYLVLSLYTDNALKPSEGSGMVTVATGEDFTELYNVFDATDRLVLGTLSFRVKDGMLPEITRRFDQLESLVWEKNHAKDAPDHTGSITGTNNAGTLLYFNNRATGRGDIPWGIGICFEDEGDYKREVWNDANKDEKARATFTYNFPKTIIAAEAAEAELILNAYQVYTDGHVSDVDAALQKYSPAITVTYSDGSQGNFIMPWGRASDDVDGLPWTASVVTDQNDATKRVVTDGVTDAARIQYDPTASRYKPENQVYLVTKSFCYEETYEETYEEDGELKTETKVEAKIFPVPVKVKLTVTPITLVDVTANDLHKTYPLTATMVNEDSPSAILSLGALKLPTQARLITDIPAGGVTLTMDIPGWSHEQTYQNGTKDYWPSAGTGTDIKDLWRDDAKDDNSANSRQYLHWPTKNDSYPFTTVEGNGRYVGANRAGEYTFTMAESYGGEPVFYTRSEIQAAYPWLTVPDNDAVPDNKEAWPIEDATRTIVWNEDPDKPDEPKLEDINLYRVTYVSTTTDGEGQPVLTLQVAKYDAAGNNIVAMLENSVFRIKLPDGTEMGWNYSDDVVTLDDWFVDKGSYTANKQNLSDMYDGYWGFHLITNPGDPETGAHGTDREKLRRYINLGGWFSVAIKEIPTGTEVPSANETLWSDFIPVYVPPRDNLYTESKEYNFIGENADLYPWLGSTLPTTLILPAGVYTPVKINGSNIEPDYATGTIRRTEAYGIATTYDGSTGAQPGRLNTFTVDPPPSPALDDDWRKSGPVPLTNTVDGTTRQVITYGPEVFLHDANYPAYGKVKNQMDGAGYAASAYQATVRLEKRETDPDDPEDPELEEKIILEYVSTSGGERSVDTDGVNVTAVIYETRTEGYTMRQDYTLVIRNVGSVDISGLSIDLLSDLSSALYTHDMDLGGGHFELLKPPASFLPAGESTTFVLTYVYDLQTGPDHDTMDYRDKLFITSNRKNKTGDGTVAGQDYLLDFDAQFQVTTKDIHRVFVKVEPSDESMGTAGVIVGLVDNGDGSQTMNTTAGTTAFPGGERVYIMVTPTDEYNWFEVTAVDSTGTPVIISEYRDPNVAVPDNVGIYWFVMPDFDTTVTVKFHEPTISKLRLGDLRVYADNSEDGMDLYYPDNPANSENPDTEDAWNERKIAYLREIWQKTYTEEEERTADTWSRTNSEYGNLYRMTAGSAGAPGFDNQWDQYIAVIPADADWAQVEVTLRKVVFFYNDNKGLLDVEVVMDLFDTDNVPTMEDNKKDIYPRGTPYYKRGMTNGPDQITGEPTTHTSMAFEVPESESRYVRVTLSHANEADPSGTERVSRSYYIEIHRAPASVESELNYGNSPYGMIMNDGTIRDKAAAKEAFVNNNFSFTGLTTGVPAVVKDHGLADLHYWSEAWTLPTELWTSPDADWTGMTTYDGEDEETGAPTTTMGPAVYDDETGMSKALYDLVRTPEVNLDLNDYAFFAIMGQTFKDPGILWARDSSGRYVDLSTATLSLWEVYTLDTTAAANRSDGQLGRFALPDDADAQEARTVTLNLQKDGVAAAAVSGDVVAADWAVWYLSSDGSLNQTGEGTKLALRPGRYRLVYTFPDYNYIKDDPDYGDNYLTITRDFVILAPVGDVNADLTVSDTVDEKLIKNRVSPNAGYPALGYMADNYSDAAIFKLRTVDVNNDRNINNIDANAIHQKTGVTTFYLPVDYK